MAKFDSYSFCRAHAASYAVLSWALAFLKAHEPAVFWVSALNNNRGMYEKWVYVEAAKRDGIPFLLPCVNRSGPEFVLEGPGIRVGLLLLFGLSEGTLQRILRAREEAGPFQGLRDFLRRVSCRLEEVAGLIKAGAFDFTGVSRPQLQWDLRMGYASGQKLCKETLLSLPCSGVRGPRLPDLSPRMKAREEWRMLRLSVGPHPLSWFHESLKKERIFSSASLSRHVGQKVRVAGLNAAGRDTITMKGEEMGFITLDDQEGLVEVCLFPRDYARLRNAFTAIGPYLVEGTVQDQYGALSLTPSRARRL
jgi:DNA polymerase III alpha subunit